VRARNDGTLAWESDLIEWPWGFGGAYSVASAYGLVYRFSYGGVTAFDWETGDKVWQFQAPAPPYETPYSSGVGSAFYPWDSGCQIVDGKMYVANSEHSQSQPLTRGYRLFCLNATTGVNIWNITGFWSTPGPAADGYLTAGNQLDGYMYVFGKGKSETTVTATDVSIPLGTSFTIKGTVLDMSPGQSGTPCVSKDSMTTQMEYLHMQHPIDGYWHNLTITGVPVALTAIGEDGDFVDLGTVTTDGYHGTFGKSWTPDKEGMYKIIASFESDESYGSSSASTYVTVGPAPASDVTPEPTPEPGEPTQPLISTEAALIIGAVVIAAVVIIAYVVMRKR
jgi:outer membrane protein assembly factor BamB